MTRTKSNTVAAGKARRETMQKAADSINVNGLIHIIVAVGWVTGV